MMYAERRLAFEKRIGELLQDHRNAYPASRNVSNNQWRDIASRILSALEDAYQMGKKIGWDEGFDACLTQERGAGDFSDKVKAEVLGIYDSIKQTSPFQPPPVTKYSDPRSCPDCHADHDHAALGCTPCTFGKHELPPEVVEQQRRLDAADRMVDKVFAPPTPIEDEKNG
jgi:hypothetical protein